MHAERLRLTDLESMVRRCEAALLAGTSTHRDVLNLIDAEREILRRERTRDREAGAAHDPRGSRTGQSTTRPSTTGRSTAGGGRLRV